MAFSLSGAVLSRTILLLACFALLAAPARAAPLAAADEPPFVPFYKQLAVKILRGNTAVSYTHLTLPTKRIV